GGLGPPELLGSAVVVKLNSLHTPGTGPSNGLFPAGERGELTAAAIDFPQRRPLDGAQQRLDVGARAARPVVPPHEVAQLLRADRRRRAPPHRIGRAAV